MGHGDDEYGLPRYSEIPIESSKPPRSAWGVFGEDDEVGTINLLTPERVARAAQLVRKGRVFSLNWDLEKPNPLSLAADHTHTHHRRHYGSPRQSERHRQLGRPRNRRAVRPGRRRCVLP